MLVLVNARAYGNSCRVVMAASAAARRPQFTVKCVPPPGTTNAARPFARRRRRHRRRPANPIGSTPNPSPLRPTITPSPPLDCAHAPSSRAAYGPVFTFSYFLAALVRGEFSHTHKTLSLSFSLSHAFRVRRSALGATQPDPCSGWSRAVRAWVYGREILLLSAAPGVWVPRPPPLLTLTNDVTRTRCVLFLFHVTLFSLLPLYPYRRGRRSFTEYRSKCHRRRRCCVIR